MTTRTLTAYRMDSAPIPSESLFNVSFRKVGGIYFVRIGFFTMSFCVSRKRTISNDR